MVDRATACSLVVATVLDSVITPKFAFIIKYQLATLLTYYSSGVELGQFLVGV